MSKPVRKLFTVEEEKLEFSEAPKVEIDREADAERVVKRLKKIIAEHHKASLSLSVNITRKELKIVTNALRDHARGGLGKLVFDDSDEILAHCLNRLFEELVEEPSNILYVTSTGPDSNRYDAMDAPFWIECLDLLELSAESDETK